MAKQPTQALSAGLRIKDEYRQLVVAVERLFAGHDCLLPFSNRLAELKNGAVRPFTVAVFGWMKTGKSSLINALLNKHLAITGVNETTATLNVISRAPSPEMSNRFTVFWNDSPPQNFEMERLAADWTGTSQDVLDRVAKVRRLQLYSDAPWLDVHEIIDTPGIGTTAIGHGDAARRVIDANVAGCETADALIYVFGPNVRDADMRELSVYAKTSMQNGNAYNSVGVLHLWDSVYLNNGGDIAEIEKLARKAYEYSREFVSKVLPVSAPLAFAAQSAPDEFFEGIRVLCDSHDKHEICSWLSACRVWDASLERARLRQYWTMPWASFAIIVREGMSVKSSIDLRQRILALSGIDQLRAVLDKQIFSRNAVIQQRQQYANLYRIGQSALQEIRCKVEELKRCQDCYEEIVTVPDVSKSTIQWVRKQLENVRSCKDDLEMRQIKLEKLFMANEIAERILDMDALQWYHDSELCDDAIYVILEKIFNSRLCYKMMELDHVDKRMLRQFARDELPVMKVGMREPIALKLIDHLSMRVRKALDRR